MRNAVIIGAGPAGLTAAYELIKKTDIKPIILEQSSMIGGISKTVEHNGNRIDIGGHRFFSKSDLIMNLWFDLMPVQGKPSIDDLLLNNQKAYSENNSDPQLDDNVMLIRQRVSRIFYLRKFFDYPISLKLSTFKNMGFLRTFKAGLGYIYCSVFKRKENSLEDFYINRFGKPLYKMFFEGYTEKVWGVHPSKISPDWGSQRVKGLSLSKAVLNFILSAFKKDREVETSLIEQFFYPKKGPGQLWELMAEKIVELGGEIRLNTAVDKIDLIDGKINFVASGEEKFKADYFFSTMPINDLISSMNNAPENVQEISSKLPFRDFITVGLLLNKLKIKNETKIKTVSNLVPDCWIYIQEKDVKIGRLQIFNNWSPYMVKDFENTVWVGLEYFCSEGDEMWKMPDDKFIEFAIDELSSIGIIDKGDVLDKVKLNIKKAYPAYFGTYSKFDDVKSYLNSIDNLYCIGRNGQHRYNNMDHSMLTAIEAVKIIINGGDKERIWNVNTENEYHESK